MKRVVLVEDQTAVREMLSQIVNSLDGFAVIAECTTGQEALRVVTDKQPDIVFLDVMLPELNGVEVLRRFSRQMPRMKVIIFSAMAQPALLRDLVEAGANGIVGKAARLADVKACLAAVSQGDTWYAPEVKAALEADRLSSGRSSGLTQLSDLTAREREILQLIAESFSTKEIASKLSISVKTAENHRTNLMRKLDLHDVASLTRFAIENGLVEVPPNL